MGVKARLKKIKKMALKKAEKKEIEKEISQEESEDLEQIVLNSAIHPPYQVIVDTNFVNDCIRKKVDLLDTLITSLEGNVHIAVTECVYGELEKMGRLYRPALSMLKASSPKVLKCNHKGTYADNCILERVKEHRCYVVATNDTGLRQRIKKYKGIPLVFFRGRRVEKERFVG